MACDIDYGCSLRRGLRALPLVALLMVLSGCALMQPPAPVPVTDNNCEQQEREIVRLHQILAEKDAQIQQQRVQQNVQAQALKETTGEVARAEIKLRRLATQSDAASQLAEVEVALHGLRAETLPRNAAAQLLQAQRILDAGSASFAQGDYGAAVEFAAQSQAIIDMAASGRHSLAAAAAVEVPFQVPVALRARIDSNLRAQPGRTASVVGVLRQGTPLQAHAYRGAWLRVRTEDGRAGWVLGTLLEAPPPAAQ